MILPHEVPHVRDENLARRARQALVARLEASDLFRNYQRAFQGLTGLPLALRAAGSFQPPMQGTKRANGLCTLLAARNKTCAACLDMQARLERAACTRARTEQCFAGLHESAIPVHVGGQVVAYLQTGQVLFARPTAAETRAMSRRLATVDPATDIDAVQAGYAQSVVITRAHYEEILLLLEIFAQQLATLSNQLVVAQTHLEAPPISKAREYIAAHLTERLSLPDVSRAVGMSSYYFCKSFKKATGLNYTDYLSRLRVELVKQLMLDPYKRVSEAAFEAGFQSLSQFNRVFNRVAGQAPSAYREQLHEHTRGQAA